jgi:hypothetical protein
VIIPLYFLEASSARKSQLGKEEEKKITNLLPTNIDSWRRRIEGSGFQGGVL